MTDKISSTIRMLLQKYGFGKGTGIVLERLLMSNTYLSVEDLKKDTKYSKSMISNILANMTEIRVVKRKKQGKKYLYHLENDFLINLDRSISKRLSNDLKALREILSILHQNMNIKRRNLIREIKKFETYINTRSRIYRKLR